MTDLRKAAELALEALENGWISKERLENLIAALRQALAQPEQEPVAWVLNRELFWPSEYEILSEDGDNAIPLYTAPPKREWQGLTDEEVFDIANESRSKKWGHIDETLFYKLLEFKLKEKNI